MKRKLLIVAAACLALLVCFAFSFTASAEETEPTVSIEKFNLAFEDNTYIKYAVKFVGIDDAKITTDNIGMLYWTDTADGFVPGAEDFSSATTGYTTIDGEKYYVFKYTNMVAKQLADYVYSVAYLEYDGETYYSAPVKFSALEYCYSKLGKTGVASTNADFRNLLTATLEQGAAAQKYFKYNTDRLANANYYQINLVGGTFEDGFSSGLFLATDEVKITAPETSGDLIFAGWKNSAGEITLENNVDTLKNITKNETYTATYCVKYSEGLEFTWNGYGTCSVSGIGSCTDSNVVIPPTSPSGYRVTSIGDSAFSYCTKLKSVVIPDSVTSIGSRAFDQCAYLAEVVIGNGVTFIGDYAFYRCTKIASIVIPDSVTSIGNSAFSYCTKLKSVVIPDSVTSIGSRAFDQCAYLAEVVIGNGVTFIGDYAFYNCDSLFSIEIPDSVTSIGAYAFADCSGLFSCVIGDGVTSIGEKAFYYCSNFSSIVISDSVTYIGDKAFDSCYYLTIYCEAASKPSGWSSSWNYLNRPVVWGYTGN